jgi:hypothetical protein
VEEAVRPNTNGTVEGSLPTKQKSSFVRMRVPCLEAWGDVNTVNALLFITIVITLLLV